MRNKEKQLAWHHAKTRNNKLLVTTQYSDGNTPVCNCPSCKEERIEFLCIDHVNGGGTKHRKELGMGGSTFYTWLIKNNFPDGYQVLCHNCNQSYGFMGYCPHQYENLGAWWNK